jgi:hypothetical protein
MRSTRMRMGRHRKTSSHFKYTPFSEASTKMLTDDRLHSARNGNDEDTSSASVAKMDAEGCRCDKEG